MGDSAATLWESELLRARQWIAARRRDQQQERERIFRRVQAHVGFRDHQRSLQSDATASEDEDDLVLAFLGDVDAADMNALLRAEAEKAAALAPRVEAAPPAKTLMPSAADLMRPLAMPTSLASPTLKPKAKAVPMSQLDPKTARTAAGASATLGTEAAVQELMQDLQLDVAQLQHADVEETKTEESTLPHLVKVLAGKRKGVSGTAQADKARAGATPSKYMQQVAQKSPRDPHEKKAAAPAATKGDDVGAEMLSWVSGYRDPEVIRRKENMRRKRKHTHRYGMSSEEEQRQVLRRVKQIARDSNSESESEDDFSSDYSPAEEDEVPEPDEPEVVDLLSDDYLNSDEDAKTVKRKRKRLRQAESAQKKKKPRSRKPAVTRKLTQQGSNGKGYLHTDKPSELQAPANSGANHTRAMAKNVSVVRSDEDTSNQPVEVLASEDETGDSDKRSFSSTIKGTQAMVVEPDATKGSTILRLKIPKAFQSLHDRQGDSNNSHQAETIRANTDKSPSQSTGRAKTESATADTPPGSASNENIVVGKPSSGASIQEQINSSGDDAEFSDSGTVDLEGEELSVGNVEHTPDEDITTAEGVAGSDAGSAKVNTVESLLENAETKTSVEEASPKDEDVSEAETEILEDDEPDTDDLGLNYSDDSDADDKPVNSKMNNGSNETSASADKGGGSTLAPTAKENKNGDDNGKPMDNDSGDKSVDSSTAGVQQFFDFTPLKLKPKAKTTTTTAPKPLPVHGYAETHLSKGNNDLAKRTADTKQTPQPEKQSIASNGLRPSKKPIATSTVMKGKFAVTRRSTKLLDPEDTPGAKRPQKKQYIMVPTQKSNGSTGTKDLDDVPLTMLAKELSKKTKDTTNTRYLSYAGAKKTEDAPTYAVETTRTIPKSRFGGGSESNPKSLRTEGFSAPTNGQASQMNDKIASRGGYRREPQISIYDALHMDGQESASDIREGTGYKRPSRFKKMQEEAARNGTPMVKSRLQDTDWDKVAIPKKKKPMPQLGKSEQDEKQKALHAKDYGSRNGVGKNQNKRRKKNTGPSNKNAGPSYYGPKSSQSATSDRNESPSRGRRGRENGYRRDDDRWRKRSQSPLSRERDRYSKDGIFRDDHRRRGSSRSRSRSPSTRGRDYSSSRYRRRSWSPSRSREKSSERDYRRTDRIISSSRDRDRDPRANRRSASPGYQVSSKKSADKSDDPPELGEVCQNGKLAEGDRSAKKQKHSHYADEPPSSGALATFDDDADNIFISDSDDDGSALIKETEDIRFDLESVPVNEALMARQVYVTGVNPTVCAEQIEEDFARFGVAVSGSAFVSLIVLP
ncbi:unnamed protein product [Phytophthora fragariaefolia]|uniref:Unnamed protein product n=1 Tax=Phytophthora fragariaefolia TaxID=1490495 RepID=A0A9W7CLU3_9STRA|nr:unnamed protein product [Phytophthora fragariaefolia]